MNAALKAFKTAGFLMLMTLGTATAAFGQQKDPNKKPDLKVKRDTTYTLPTIKKDITDKDGKKVGTETQTHKITEKEAEGGTKKVTEQTPEQKKQEHLDQLKLKKLKDAEHQRR